MGRECRRCKPCETSIHTKLTSSQAIGIHPTFRDSGSLARSETQDSAEALPPTQRISQVCVQWVLLNISPLTRTRSRGCGELLESELMQMSMWQFVDYQCEHFYFFRSAGVPQIRKRC